MAFQMIATIGVGAFVGYKLDAYFATEKKYFTAAFSLLFTIIALYLSLKDFINPPK